MKVNEVKENRPIWISSKRESIAPTVSALYLTNGCAKNGYFEKTVNSVLRQNFHDLELIIIDNGTYDATTQISKRFQELDSRVSIVRYDQVITMPAICINEAIMRAKGQYLIFIFDGIILEKSYLLETLCYLSRTGVSAAYGRLLVYDNRDLYVEYGTEDGASQLSAYNCLPSESVIICRSIIDTIGMFDPHIALQDSFCWDMWRRISSHFQMEASNVFVGKKLHLSENTVSDFLAPGIWIASERMNQYRGSILKYDSYPSCDITSCTTDSTTLFTDYVKQYLAKICGHPFTEEQFGRNSTKPGKKRVAIIVPQLNATSLLTFERLQGNDAFIPQCFLHGKFSIDCLAFADAVILVRELREFEGYADFCRNMGIPLFYYLDDNIIELKRDGVNDGYIDRTVKCLNGTYLYSFDGILLSTKALIEYFDQRMLHQKLQLVEPIIGESHYHAECQNDFFTIACMAGTFRTESFVDLVLPAIIRLASEYRIQLITPTFPNSISREIKELVNWVEIPRTLSLDLALQRFGKHNIKVLIHCGPVISNNSYKTENALLNATQIGAVLMVNDNGQNFEAALDHHAALRIGNEPLDWYQAIAYLIDNPDSRSEIVRNAAAYCYSRYSRENATNSINSLIMAAPPVSYMQIIQRYSQLLHASGINSVHLSPRGITRDRFSAHLVLSKLVKKSITYKVTSLKNNLSEIGILFGCYGKATGIVNIEITDECRSIVRNCCLQLSEIDIHNWNYATFQPIDLAYHVVFTITMTFDYEENSDLVGVFEDADKRSFFYRLCNKLGHHIPGLDVLYVDFQ